MFDPVKIKSNKIFFWSDLHIGHAKDFILTQRGFTSAAEAREQLVARWNARVTNDDVGFLLGDNIVGRGTGEESHTEFKNLVRDLNYREIYILPGNHPSGFKQFYRYTTQLIGRHCVEENPENSILTFERDERKIHLCSNYLEIRIGGQFVVLSHFPVLSYNNMAAGAYMLFGHVHGSLQCEQFLRGRVLDVCVESFPAGPVEFGEVKEILEKKEILKIDLH